MHAASQRATRQPAAILPSPMSSPDLMPVEGPLTPLAWTPEQPADRAALAEAWRRLAERMASGSLVPLQERIYVEPEHRDVVLEVRAEALTAAGLDPATPVTLVANRPCLGGLSAGVHLLCWETGRQGQVSTIDDGRLLDLGRSRALFLADLHPDADADEPLQAMFDRATAALASRGMSFRDVGRTWLYVRDLLPTYDHLNQVRDGVFVEAGLGQPGAWQDPPASTGIQAWHPDDAPCFMDLVAVKDLSGERRFEPIEPELQCEAWVEGEGEVVEVDIGHNDVALSVRLPAPARVVVNQNHLPGFRATAGTVADHDGLLAVDLPAGEHSLELRYRPTRLIAGLAASGLAMLAWIVAVAVLVRRSRGPIRPS